LQSREGEFGEIEFEVVPTEPSSPHLKGMLLLLLLILAVGAAVATLNNQQSKSGISNCKLLPRAALTIPGLRTPRKSLLPERPVQNIRGGTLF
jgi:hypothetical protein